MEFDRTRKAIKAGELGQSDRKDLMSKLQGAGGQVLSEKALREQAAAKAKADQGKGKGTGGGDAKTPSQLAKEKGRIEAERQALLRKHRAAMEADATSFFARLSIKLSCKLKGLTPFRQNYVLPGFMSKLNLDLKRALMECNILGNELLANNKELARAIVKELDHKNPLYVEIIEKATKLYDRAELSELISSYAAHPNSGVALDAIRPALFSLVRKLYVLRLFQETYMIAVTAAVEIQQRIEKKQSGLYVSKVKKIRGDWKTLMDDLYPSLVLLVQRAEMKKIESGSLLFEELIGVEEEHKMGQRRPGEATHVEPEKKNESTPPPTEENLNGEEPDQEEPVVEDSDRELTYGMQLMALRPLSQLRKDFDTRSEWKELSERDKVLIAFLFLREFEEEFSVVLTTPRIRMNPSYTSGVKTDLRQKLNDTFEGARNCYDAFRKYVQETQDYLKVVNDSTFSGNYVERTKRISMFESRRGATGRNVRILIRDLMQKIRDLLRVAVEDMRNSGSIVENPDEPLKLDAQLEKRKFLQGKKIRESIIDTYCYAYALHSRLEDGDLFGGVIDLSEEEFEKMNAQSAPTGPLES